MTRADRLIGARLFSAVLAGMFVALSPAYAEIAMEPAGTAPVAPDPAIGERLYRERCEQCHGTEGAGDGPAADFVYPRPRDFTLALYKVRSTLSGEVPTDHDLFRVISEGLPGTSMPAWKKFLTEAERWQLVHYVKTFDAFGAFEETPAKEQVAIGTPPEVTPELVRRGEQIYGAKKCWQCHGRLGRGDGVSAQGMKDDWGFPIRPVNFTKSWRFRGGDSLEDIYRTFTTGFNGTPMPSFADTIPEAADRWALAAYVKSLAQAPRTGQVLRAARHDGGIPADPDHGAWKRAEPLDVFLAGQIIVEPRWFMPAHDVITVRALYNADELALLLEWDDGTRDTGADGRPADRAAVQMPLDSTDTLAGEKPYFLLGDRKRGVDWWQWDAGGGLLRSKSFGHNRIAPTAADFLRAEGRHVDGQYRVVLRRPLAGDSEAAALKPGDHVPVAFHLWDGSQNETGLKMAVSSWSSLLLEPPTQISAYLWPGAIALLAVAGEAILLRRRRRRETK